MPKLCGLLATFAAADSRTENPPPSLWISVGVACVLTHLLSMNSRKPCSPPCMWVPQPSTGKGTSIFLPLGSLHLPLGHLSSLFFCPFLFLRVQKLTLRSSWITSLSYCLVNNKLHSYQPRQKWLQNQNPLTVHCKSSSITSCSSGSGAQMPMGSGAPSGCQVAGKRGPHRNKTSKVCLP